MKPDERAPVIRAARDVLDRAKASAARRWAERGRPREDTGPREALPIVTLLIVLINIAVALRMLVGTVMADPEALVAWGGSFAPRTTNGEWWRLLTSMFVHGGLLHAAATVAGLIQIGIVTERLVGRVAFALVYVAAGLLAGLVSLSQAPVAVNVGASGAIYGVYGLFAAAAAWTFVRRTPVKLPLALLKTVLPAVGIFVLYNALTDWLVTSAERAGLAAGFFCGIALVSSRTAEQPTIRRLAALSVATVVIIIAVAVPLRGVADIRPDIARIIAMDERITGMYEARVERFTRGHVQARALTDLIDRTILPELRSSWARLKAIEGVPKDHQPLVAAAEQFLQLREKGWRIRSDALRKANMRGLQQADRMDIDAKAAREQLRQTLPE